MTDPRLVVPVPTAGETIKGPRLYFASIEKKYGRPVQEWVDLAAKRLETGARHMEVVDWLKTEHGMGHGHANAVVAWVRDRLEAGKDA
jgi:monomeric isocitrate dehydrogenase